MLTLLEQWESELMGTLQQRAAAAVQAIRDGADPSETLALVVWPPDELVARQIKEKNMTKRVRLSCGHTVTSADESKLAKRQWCPVCWCQVPVDRRIVPEHQK